MLVLIGSSKTVIKFMHAMIVEIFVNASYFPHRGLRNATWALIICVEVFAVTLFWQLLHIDLGVVLVEVDSGALSSLGKLALFLHERVEDKAFSLSEGRLWVVTHLSF